ncbi:MAG: flippase-like domain-containing protein [Candidatus Omnitrophica bacterium]|nr:flippase-like domain-containing protein [Candidatus Omnitrophota bacterium]
MPIIKRFLFYLIRLGLSVFLIFILLRKVNLRCLIGILTSANFGLLLFSFLFAQLGYILCFFRWKMILKAMKIKVSLGRLVSIFSASLFFGALFPSTVGNDLLRSIELMAHTKKTGEVLAGVFLDRLSGYAGMVIVGIFALFLAIPFGIPKEIVVGILLLLIVLILIIFGLFNYKIYKALNRLLVKIAYIKLLSSLETMHNALFKMRNLRKMLLGNIFISVLVQLSAPITAVIMAKALGFKIGVIYFLLSSPLITALTMLPISIAGLGVRDMATVFFFSRFGISQEIAFSLSFLSFGFILGSVILSGIVYVATLHYRRL